MARVRAHHADAKLFEVVVKVDGQWLEMSAIYRSATSIQRHWPEVVTGKPAQEVDWKGLSERHEHVIQRVAEAAGVAFPAAEEDVAKAVEELKARCERAEADNAALRDALMRVVGDSQESWDSWEEGDGTPLGPLLGRVLGQPSPGAALMEELEGLRIAQGAALEELRVARSQVADLEAARDSYRDEKRSLERAKDRMLKDMAELKQHASDARDAALEEAAKVARDYEAPDLGFSERMATRVTAADIAQSIRALKGTK